MGKGRKRGKGKVGMRTRVPPLAPLVGEAGEGEVAADEVVVDKEAGMAGTPLPETEHGRTKTKRTLVITIRNVAMTKMARAG